MALKETEERRVASQECRAAMSERRVMMEERRIAIHETMLKNKREQKLMFMNPTGFDQKEKQ
jgi:hypothetical protein